MCNRTHVGWRTAFLSRVNGNILCAPILDETTKQNAKAKQMRSAIYASRKPKKEEMLIRFTTKFVSTNNFTCDSYLFVLVLARLISPALILVCLSIFDMVRSAAWNRLNGNRKIITSCSCSRLTQSDEWKGEHEFEVSRCSFIRCVRMKGVNSMLHLFLLVRSSDSCFIFKLFFPRFETGCIGSCRFSRQTWLLCNWHLDRMDFACSELRL